MYSALQLAAKYVQYYCTAGNGKGHGIHSPFVFDFVLHVLNNKKQYKAPGTIEELRKNLLQDKTIIQVEDLGAGSRSGKTKDRSIQQIARTAVKPKKYGQLLYRLVQHYRPDTIIELGTSLGITTAYLATANPAAQIVTIEGSIAILERAKKNFELLQLNNIQPLPGNFDELLPRVLREVETVGVAYVDGNHRYAPTLDYFQQLLQKAGNDTILIFDDIHWSRAMEKAWQYIQHHPAVRCTIDLFFLGFVFFRSDFKEQQHFIIRY